MGCGNDTPAVAHFRVATVLIDRRRLLIGLAVPLAGAVVGGCVAHADDAPPPAPATPGAGDAGSPPPAVETPSPPPLNAEGFDAWLTALRAEAAQRGFTQRTIDLALGGVKLIPRVVELDRQQPEVTLTFDQYLARVVNDTRAQKARQNLGENRALLNRVQQRFGVQPRFIVALWGIETDFGRVTGGFSVLDALTTLAYDGRRSAFFRQELFNALTMIQSRGVSPREMRGSWAGAMGQSQFMPSTYLAHAVDFDGDGKPDIWSSRADVFASIAKYLADLGWRADETWGRAARLPDGFDSALIAGVRLDKPARTLAQWSTLGVKRSDGGALPRRDLSAWLIQPSGAGDSSGFLVYSNYRALLQWNRSLFFATAVGYLADRIEQG
jgi:membrane-bound lytic murein transglycosylase B